MCICVPRVHVCIIFVCCLFAVCCMRVRAPPIHICCIHMCVASLTVCCMLVCVCLCPHISPTPGMQVSYMILQRVSPVTHSIGNCVKRVAVIVASVIVFRNPMPLQNTIGECELVAAARLFLGSCQVASLLCSGLGVGRFLYCMDCIACFVLHVLYCVYCIA